MMLAAWATYDSYKDSGEGWIEDVPAHWETRKLKQLFQEKRHRPNLALNCGAISFGEVVEKDDERVPLATKASYQEVLAGEFLVNPLNLNYDLKSLRIGLSDINVVVSAGYIVLQAKDDMDKRYFKYLLHRYDVANMKLLGSGVRQTISFNHIANSILVAPPLPEQRAIAAFLDEKCAKMDEAVRIKEEQIALLRERRQILIQQAVTRGLNPSAPMKDSGIDWIGQIPAHWEVAKLKFLSNKIVDGTHFTPTYVEEGVPFLRVTDLTNMKDGHVDWENVRRIPEKEHRELSKRANAEYGDVLLSKNGTIGITRVVDWKNEFSFFVSLCLIKLRKELSPNYFVSFFGSPLVDEQLYFGSLRTSVTNLHLEKIKELLIVVPPRSEQDELVAQISIISKPIDDAIRIKEDQIAALKEYKASLINAAVTGKIKVA